MAAFDLNNFKPKSLDELAQGLKQGLQQVLMGDAAKFVPDICADLQTLGEVAWQTRQDLADSKLSPSDATLALQGQRAALDGVLVDAKFCGYVTADDVRKEVFAVIKAAIRNTTGVSLPI